MTTKKEKSLYKRLKRRVNNLWPSKGDKTFNTDRREFLKSSLITTVAIGLSPTAVFAQSKERIGFRHPLPSHWTKEQKQCYEAFIVARLDTELSFMQANGEIAYKPIKDDCVTLNKIKGGLYQMYRSCPGCIVVEDFPKENQRSIIMMDKAGDSIGAGIDRRNPKTWTKTKFDARSRFVKDLRDQAQKDWNDLMDEQRNNMEKHQKQKSVKNSRLYRLMVVPQLDHNQNQIGHLMVILSGDNKMNPVGVLTNKTEVPIYSLKDSKPEWVLNAYHRLRAACYDKFEKKLLEDRDKKMAFFVRDMIDGKGIFWPGKICIYKNGLGDRPVNVANELSWRRAYAQVMEETLLANVASGIAITLASGGREGKVYQQTGARWEEISENQLYRTSMYKHIIQPHLDAERYSNYCPPELFQPSGKRSEGIESEKSVRIAAEDSKHGHVTNYLQSLVNRERGGGLF